MVRPQVPRRPIGQRLSTTCALHAVHVVYSVRELPTTFEPAMESSDASKWREACESECRSPKKNDTWDVVPLPAGRKAIGCKWVFKVKENQDGEIDRYKARLVAKDFRRSTAPTTKKRSHRFKFTSIEITVVSPLSHSLMFHQMDVKTAFLQTVYWNRRHLHAATRRVCRPSGPVLRVQIEAFVVWFEASATKNVEPYHRRIHAGVWFHQVRVGSLWCTSSVMVSTWCSLCCSCRMT